MSAEFFDVDLYKREGVENRLLILLYSLLKDSQGNTEMSKYTPILCKEFPNEIIEGSKKGFYEIVSGSLGNNNGYFDIENINNEKIETYIKSVIYLQSDRFYNNSYQNNHILGQLSEIFTKRDGTIIKFPKEFDIHRNEAENFEYIKTLIRLEKDGYIELEFDKSVNRMFPRTEYEDHSNISIKISNRDSGIYHLKDILIDLKRKKFTSGGFDIGNLLAKLDSKDRIGAYCLAAMTYLGKEKIEKKDFSDGENLEMSKEIKDFLLRFDEAFYNGKRFKNGKKDVSLDSDFSKLVSKTRKFLEHYPDIGYEMTNLQHSKPYCLSKTL